MDLLIIEPLFELATQLVPVGRARVIAAVMRRNKVLSIGWNTRTSSYLSRKFAKNEHALYEHAEIAAIRVAAGPEKMDLGRCTLIIVRCKMKEGRWYTGLAKPCSGCSKAITYFGIKKVIYSLEGDNVRCLDQQFCTEYFSTKI